MSLFKYLQLQPVDPRDDGTVSELDMYEEDELIDLSHDEDGDSLMRGWDAITRDMHNEG